MPCWWFVVRYLCKIIRFVVQSHDDGLLEMRRKIVRASFLYSDFSREWFMHFLLPAVEDVTLN